MKKKDKAKEAEPKGKKTFVYSFNLLDLDSKMCVAYGTSFKSEKQAFNRAMKCWNIDVEMKSVRLGRYYSFPSYVDKFKVWVEKYIPKTEFRQAEVIIVIDTRAMMQGFMNIRDA